MNRAAQWVPIRERFPRRASAPEDDQVAIYNGQLIGSVRLETAGPRRGKWVWSMSRDAPDINMRWERNGYEDTEWAAKTRVVDAYEELLRRARDVALNVQRGRLR
jgi:hypothetical protein